MIRSSCAISLRVAVMLLPRARRAWPRAPGPEEVPEQPEHEDEREEDELLLAGPFFLETRTGRRLIRTMATCPRRGGGEPDADRGRGRGGEDLGRIELPVVDVDVLERGSDLDAHARARLEHLEQRRDARRAAER